MILIDANLLLYAEDSLSEHHEAVRTWWDERWFYEKQRSGTASLLARRTAFRRQGDLAGAAEVIEQVAHFLIG